MAKENKAKKSIKPIVVGAMTIILLAAITWTSVQLYQWSYKRGYADGTNNQVLCQAALKDNTLAKLCK